MDIDERASGRSGVRVHSQRLATTTKAVSTATGVLYALPIDFLLASKRCCIRNIKINAQVQRAGGPGRLLSCPARCALACRSVQAHTCTYILSQALDAGEYTVTHLQSSSFSAPTAEEPLAPENSSQGASFHMSVPVAAVNFDAGFPVVLCPRTRPRCITTVLLFPTSPEV